MGCTSSAPNMAQNRTAEKSIQFEEQISDSSSKDVDEIIYRAANDINVLPSCDTLPEPIHLVRNKSTPSLNHDKEHPENGYVVESIIKAESSDVLHQEDKISRLEEVVDKVVQLHVKAEPVNTQPVEKVPEAHPATEEKTDRHNSEESNVGAAETTINQEPADIQDKEEEENPEEISSPSRSESSRATRWEALADIAAELPPSLTVDPITGQIYALSK